MIVPEPVNPMDELYSLRKQIRSLTEENEKLRRVAHDAQAVVRGHDHYEGLEADCPLCRLMGSLKRWEAK